MKNLLHCLIWNGTIYSFDTFTITVNARLSTCLACKQFQNMSDDNIIHKQFPYCDNSERNNE